MPTKRAFGKLIAFLESVPGVVGPIGAGLSDDGRWWVKFGIDISHKLSWNVVQELGHVLNYISLEERLPTVFKPVSPPPYLNGGPKQFLSWVIECGDASFKPSLAAKWLETRLPNPVQNAKKWKHDS